MNRDRGAAAVLILLALAGAAMWRPVGQGAAPWHVRLDIASVSLSISGGTPVRNRTPLFGIGHLPAMLAR